jgi:hypothetical protein
MRRERRYRLKNKSQSELVKRLESSNVSPLTDRLITLLGVRKYTTDRFPEGKMLALLLHGFVVDGVTESYRYHDARTRLSSPVGTKT